MKAEGPRAKQILHGVFPALSAALFISMGYIDPGKWAASIDSGARFGGDLALYLFFFNLGASLCQYLSLQIGLATGKNLAEICSAEYDQLNCTFLGIQVEVSILVSDLAMILGIANGLHMILGVDLSSGVLLAALDALLYPLLSTLLVNPKAKGLVVHIAGLAFVFYVLAMLIGLPESSVPHIHLRSKLTGEKAYALMSLLGANIIPHNFYLHSSLVQRFQGSPGEARAGLDDKYLYSIFAIFSSIFLVNYIMMNSASNAFYSYGVVLSTFQDAMSLMEESVWSPMKPLAFVLLIASSHIRGLSWEINGEGRQTILHNFFGIDLPGWLHCAAVRIFAIIPAVYCVWYSGAEGMYQMLISTQIMVGLLVPASLVALYRVASSGALMGAYKISRVMELLMTLSLSAMIGFQIIFLGEMVFGDGAWLRYLRWNMGTTRISSPHFIFIAIGCTSFVLTNRLFAAPLRSLETCQEPCRTPEASSELKVDAVDGEPATRKDGEEGETRKPEVAPKVLKAMHTGMCRSTRRQVAAVLEEFWAQLYDYSGQFTQDAKAKKLDSLLGAVSNSKPPPSSKKVVETPADAPISIRQRLPRVSPSPSLLALRATPPGFGELPSLRPCRNLSPSRSLSVSDDELLWHKQSYERVGIDYKMRAEQKSVGTVVPTTPVVESTVKLIQSLRDCIHKLLRLNGSEWLFRHTEGADEQLFEQVAARERLVCEAEANEHSPEAAKPAWAASAAKADAKYAVSPLPDCGEDCIWKPDLIVSFGVWSIHRILELSSIETRPELWGKYTFVLNRLQGVVDQAFFVQRSSLLPCSCIHEQRLSNPFPPGGLLPTTQPPHGKFTTARFLLDLIKMIEAFICNRKGRPGTAAGNIAFPKGKENLTSVLKRYKRRLSNMPVNGGNNGPDPCKLLPSDPFAA